MFLVPKSEDKKVSGLIFGSPRAIFRVRPGVGQIEPNLGVWGKKNNDFSEIDPGTHSEGRGVQKTRFYRD